MLSITTPEKTKLVLLHRRRAVCNTEITILLLLKLEELVQNLDLLGCTFVLLSHPYIFHRDLRHSLLRN